MITLNQIKRLIENIYVCPDSENRQYISSVRDNFMPLFQFNIEVDSLDEAKKIFSKISQNVSSNTFVPLLPDEEHSKDIIGNLTIETPSIFEWQNSGNGQNLVIDYTSESILLILPFLRKFHT